MTENSLDTFNNPTVYDNNYGIGITNTNKQGTFTDRKKDSTTEGRVSSKDRRTKVYWYKGRFDKRSKEESESVRRRALYTLQAFHKHARAQACKGKRSERRNTTKAWKKAKRSSTNTVSYLFFFFYFISLFSLYQAWHNTNKTFNNTGVYR